MFSGLSIDALRYIPYSRVNDIYVVGEDSITEQINVTPTKEHSYRLCFDSLVPNALNSNLSYVVGSPFLKEEGGLFRIVKFWDGDYFSGNRKRTLQYWYWQINSTNYLQIRNSHSQRVSGSNVFDPYSDGSFIFTPKVATSTRTNFYTLTAYSESGYQLASFTFKIIYVKRK